MTGLMSIASDTSVRRKRFQKGNLQMRHGSWWARYQGWDRNKDGARVWRAQFANLGRVEDYPTQAKIYDIFTEFMREINRINSDLADGDPNLNYFIEHVYLASPSVLALEKSTIRGYLDIFRLHLKPLLEKHTLGGLQPVSVVRLLEQLARDKHLSKTTLGHIKAFISGIFTFARNQGYYNGANPVQGVKLPKAKPPADTYAYSLEEERQMMKVMSSPKARLAIAVASWTGVDKGELEGLRWEDRKGGDIFVERKIWEGNLKDPKTVKRKAPIPEIPHLTKMLDDYWKSVGSPADGWVFSASRGDLPVRMDNLSRREINPDLKKAKLAWHGWHAFRRGLATNLRAMGIPDDVIQRILRHADISTSQKHYAKTLPPSVRKAMKKLDSKLTQKAAAAAAAG